jgi:hypothetical protein
MANEMEMITLKQICEELDIKPAAARRKLRGKLGKSEGDFRWEFTEEQAAEVKAILMAKAEVKEAAE